MSASLFFELCRSHCFRVQTPLVVSVHPSCMCRYVLQRDIYVSSLPPYTLKAMYKKALLSRIPRIVRHPAHTHQSLRTHVLHRGIRVSCLSASLQSLTRLFFLTRLASCPPTYTPTTPPTQAAATAAAVGVHHVASAPSDVPTVVVEERKASTTSAVVPQVQWARVFARAHEVFVCSACRCSLLCFSPPRTCDPDAVNPP